MSVASATDVETGQPPRSDKLTLLPLIALVVGSMIGGGVFNLPSDMAGRASHRKACPAPGYTCCAKRTPS